MAINKNKRNRRSIRLKKYDYTSPGWYYITICTHNRECLFGDINIRKMVLSPIGKTAREYWLQIPNHFPDTDLDEFALMPNHVHGIIIINDKNVNNRGADDPRRDTACRVPTNQFGKPVRGSLSTIMGSYQSTVTKKINVLRHTPGAKLWQPGFYEHIIRNDHELHEIRNYIRNNPIKWELGNEASITANTKKMIAFCFR